MSVVAGAAVVAILLVGCQGDPDPSANGPSSQPSSSAEPSNTDGGGSATPTASSLEPASPEPSPASSAGPAANIPVPVKPALADENTAEGLEAFTKYWFELLSFSYLTNDWTGFDQETDPGCRTCASIKSAVHELYRQGRWLGGGEVSVLSFDTAFELTTTGAVTAYVENQQSSIQYFNEDGSVARTVPQQNPPALDVVNAIYEEDGWFILDYGAPEGTS